MWDIREKLREHAGAEAYAITNNENEFRRKAAKEIKIIWKISASS